MRIVLCGNGNHGKSTVAGIIHRLTGLRYTATSSQYGAPIAWAAGGHALGYANCEELHRNRRQHRQLFVDAISRFNEPDGLRLYRWMLAEQDVIDRVCRKAEFDACQAADLFDISIYVTAAKRVSGTDPSNEMTPSDCDFVIQNNGTLADLADITRKILIRAEVPLLELSR